MTDSELASQDSRELRNAHLLTYCREERRDGTKCGATAEFILWGKLLAPEALGPRCYDHAAKHVGARSLGDPAWAISDLRPLLRASERSEGR